MPDPAPRAEDVEDAGRPLRLRCRCLFIARAARPAPRRARGRRAAARARCWCASATAASAARTCTTSTTAASAPCASSEPMILGHEVAGTVEAVGDGVDHGEAGRPCRGQPEPALRLAAATASKACPTSAWTCASTAARCATPHVQGAFRDLLVCDAVQCEPVAEGVPLAARGAGRAVLGGAARRRARRFAARQARAGLGLRPDRRLAVAAARVHGAAEIVAVDVVDETARRRPGDRRAAGRSTSPPSATGCSATRADKGTFDVMLECSGNERALRDGLDVMRPRGVVVQLGLGGDVSAAAERRRRQGARDPRLVPLPRRVRARGAPDQRRPRRPARRWSRAPSR